MEKLFVRYDYITDEGSETPASTLVSIASGYTMANLRDAIATADSLSAAEKGKILVTDIEILNDGTTPAPDLWIIKGTTANLDEISHGDLIGAASINFVIVDGVAAYSQDYVFDGVGGTIVPNTGTWPLNSTFTVCYSL